MATVLIISNIRILDDTGRATGPGLRAWGIAEALADRGHRAILAEPRFSQPRGERDARGKVRLAWWTPGTYDLRPLVSAADVVIVQAAGEIAMALARSNPRCLVVDLYNPVVPEHLALDPKLETSAKHFEWVFRSYRYFLNRGDVFLCAGERQRLFTLGALAHAGRLNPYTRLDELLRVVPMGIDPAAPLHPPSVTRDELPRLRGPVVPADAELLLWPGGIYGWFEAVTAVRALARLRQTRPKAALLFVGAENPQQPLASQSGVAAARAAARELGLLDAGVYFTPWLPYADRGAMYREADLAVITHRPLLEAQLSWRTRCLDCLGGGLPLVITAGDEVGEIAEGAGAALCVPPEDPEALAATLESLLADPARRAAMAAAARQLAEERWSWTAVIEPLHQICLSPGAAPDRPVIARLGVGAAARYSTTLLARRYAVRAGGWLYYRLARPLTRARSRRLSGNLPSTADAAALSAESAGG